MFKKYKTSAKLTRNGKTLKLKITLLHVAEWYFKQ